MFTRKLSFWPIKKVFHRLQGKQTQVKLMKLLNPGISGDTSVIERQKYRRRTCKLTKQQEQNLKLSQCQ